MLGLTPGNRSHARKGGTSTGAAWLSSARAVKCRVKSLTSATPVVSCSRVMPSTLARLPVSNRRKVGMTSSPHGPYVQGCKRATMARTKRCEAARRSKSQKTRPSSDCRLQLACMKSESLVIADQLRRGECVPEPCTHRPSRHGSRKCPKSPYFNGAHGKAGDWDEVVTR